MAGVAAPIRAQPVGIASATSGDPLGKPPEEVERVLHVGVDVKAGEIVTTGVNDRAHLLFLDGTALSVGPQARLTLDKFVYDSDKKLGELSVSAAHGIFRLVGGRISKSVPITIVTPSSTIAIRGGIVMFNVEPTKTTATFVFGYEMTLTSQGRTQSITAPGWQVSSVRGLPPGPAMKAPRGSLASDMRKLEGGVPSGSSQPSRGADQAAKTSGFADQNSGRGPGVRGPIQGGPAPGGPSRPGPGGPASGNDPGAMQPLYPGQGPALPPRAGP